MELLLVRKYKGIDYTVGDLYIDGEFFSNTLEDTDRGLKNTMSLEEIKKIKVNNETAIPTGTYKIDMSTYSPRFGKKSWAQPYGGFIPRLVNVPGYLGVLIHPGNTNKDTSGCILIGKNSVKGQVTESQNAFHKLMNILKKVQNNITITIQ